MKQILMANDLSSRSDLALRRAIALAAQFDAELEVLAVLEEMFLEATTRANVAFATQALADQIASIPGSQDAKIATRVIVGLDYEDIIRRADEIDADLIVLGVHRHKQRELFRGTTAERVIRFGRQPVLVVKDTPSAPYANALVATDTSAHATAASLLAAKFTCGGQMSLLHALQRPLLTAVSSTKKSDDHRHAVKTALTELVNQIDRDLGRDAPGCSFEICDGRPVEAIETAVAQKTPDLLAVGTHGRTGLAQAVIGSVAEQVLTQCPTDVLVVKAP